MEIVIVLLMLATFVAFMIGLVNPSLIMRWSIKPSRWKVLGWFLLINLILFILFAIVSRDSYFVTDEDECEKVEQMEHQSNDSINDALKINENEILKKKVADEIKSWGAKDAYFNDDNYFVYCVDPSDLATSGDEVAKSMFFNVQEVPGVKGCIVLDYKTKKKIGKYKVK